MPKKTPDYRQRKDSDQALVTLMDAVTRERRDYWLGTFGTPESRELYHRLIAEWEANARALPQRPTSTTQGSGGVSVEVVVADYWKWASTYYSVAEVATIQAALRPMLQLFGTTPAADFGPKRLRLVREAMIKGDPTGKPPRLPWSRSYINDQIHRIAAMFRWAAGQELLPAAVYHQLKTMESLKPGRTTAHEPEPVGPVSGDLVDAVKPLVSRQVWAIIELQRLTGARGGELFKLRPKDIVRTGSVWTYSPQAHKTAHLGRTRTIYLGPRAQAVLSPFLLGRPDDAYLFSPREAERARLKRLHGERVTPLSCGNRPGSNRSERPQHLPGETYNADSYGGAIARACQAAFPPPPHLARIKVQGKKTKARRWETDREWKNRLGPAKWTDLCRWHKDHHWHPHQLRHTAATEIRRQFGLEAAQIALGHSSALVTEAVYAQRDMEKVAEVMTKIG